MASIGVPLGTFVFWGVSRLPIGWLLFVDFAALAEALLRKSYVKLHYPAGDPMSSIQEPIVQPEVLFPYYKSWHLIGTCRQVGRIMVFDLDTVVAVTAAVGV